MPPWLQLPGIVFLCGLHCSFLSILEAAGADVAVPGSEENASFEVSASGNPRLIRAEQSQSQEQEDMQAGPVQEAALVWMNETSTVEDPYCGGPSYVSTCGSKQPVTFIWKGITRHIRGLCVCSGMSGCTEPKCSRNMEFCRTSHKPMCADGHSCIETTGRGWQCWDPCDTVKPESEYGAHSDMVKYMRNSVCVNRASSASSQVSSQFPSSQAAHAGQPRLVAPSSMGPSSQGGQPYSQGSGTHSQLGPVSSAPSSAQTWGRMPPLNAGLYLAYYSNPFGGRVIVGQDDGEEKKT